MAGEKRVRGRVERVVQGGFGLVRDPSVGVVLCRGALAGEEVTIAVDRAERGVRFGAVVAVHAASAQRRAPPCAVSSDCGGCQFQFASPEGQRVAKKAAFEETLARAGLDVPLDAWHAGPEFGWRARVGLHAVRSESGPLRVGFHRERSRDVVAAASCLQMGDRMRRAVGAMQDILTDPAVVARCPPGASFEIDLAESFDAGSRVVILAESPPRARSDGRRPAAGSFIDAIAEHIVEAVASGRLEASGVVARRGRVVREMLGEPWLTDEASGTKFRHHALSFFQGNRHLTAGLARAVVDLVPDGPAVDLYAGVGLFALPLAARGRRVRAVEWSAFAVADLRSNAERAGLEVDVTESDVAEGLRDGAALDGATVIVDPPRSGLSPRIPDLLAERGAGRLVYVSCDAATFARDLGRLSARGFSAGRIEAFDLFPTTGHVETVCVLERPRGWRP